jgi:predicted TIM-barrel fold metal-dependent hydrolase
MTASLPEPASPRSTAGRCAAPSRSSSAHNLLETIDAFDTERSMFASDCPVDRLYSGYATLWRAFEAIVQGASEAEKAALFRANAERIYRI